MTRCRICGGELTPSRFERLGLAACSGCGAQFARTADPSAYASDAYLADQADMQWDHKRRRLEARRRMNWISTTVESGRLYEVGTATGWFLHEARCRGFEVRGVEPSPAQSAHARETLGLDVVSGFGEEQPSGPPADVACLWHVLEHAADPVALLRAVAEQLTPEGVLFLEVPNVASAVARHLGERWPPLAEVHLHVTQFTPAALQAALESAGFARIELSTTPRSAYRSRAALLRPRAAASLVRDIVLSHPRLHHDVLRGEFLRAVARRSSAVAAGVSPTAA